MWPIAARARPRPLDLPLAGGQDGATVRVRPLLAGELHSPPVFLDRGGSGAAVAMAKMLAANLRKGDWVWLPVPAFLVEHPGAGPLLVDTGMHADCAEDPKANLGGFTNAIYELRMSAQDAAPAQIRALGISPEEIRTVVMTHMHNDHTSGITQFPGARFVVTRDEWERADSSGALKGYHAPHFDHDYDWRLIDYDGDEVASHGPLARTLDLLGDGSIVLISTPGHARGHQSLLLRLSGDRRVLLTGDAAYTRAGLASGALPLIVDDEHNFRRSQDELRAYLADHPDTIVIPGHDPDTWPTLDDVYE